MFFRDPVAYLRAFLQERQGTELLPHDVVYILKTAVREILAAENLGGQCEQLGVFADWVVHDEIDRSAAGARALANIADAIPLHGTDSTHDNKWLEEVVNADLSFWKLRLELLAFCRKFDMPEGMFTTPEAWHRFALPLALEISGRPVSMSATHGGSVRQARDRLAAAALPAAHRPASLRIVAETPQKWRWLIELSDTTKIVVQVLFGTFRGTDFPTPQGWVSPLS